MIHKWWDRVGFFLFWFIVCLFLFLLLDFFRLLYKSLQKELKEQNIATKILKELLDIKRQQMQAFAGLFSDHSMQRLCLLWHYWKTLPFLSLPQLNNARFQRINFVKLKFFWISLKFVKKNKYVIDINIGVYLLFLSIPKE